jgi:predicted metal-dependent hydrolase
MSKVQPHEIELLGESVTYELRYSPQASEPRIDVEIRGVTVVLPEHADTQPAELLRENASWVLEKQQMYQTYRDQAPERVFEAGEMFPFLGKPHKLVTEPRQRHAVSEQAICLRQSTVEQSSVRQALQNFYRRQARQLFAYRAERYASRMGLEYEQIEIRNQRTKWGSCSTSGTLSFNWRLMMASPEVIDYIVIHEVAHLREANHTQAFWDIVGEYDPAYASHAEWLTENSTQLIFSEDDL